MNVTGANSVGGSYFHEITSISKNPNGTQVSKELAKQALKLMEKEPGNATEKLLVAARHGTGPLPS